MSNTIYLIPTVLAPDTAAQVLPSEVIEAIKTLDIFFVENIKTARRFISSLKLGKIIDELTFITLDKKTPFEEAYNQVIELKGDAGIISEAGCPGIADPGALVVEIAHQLNLKVVPLVGPSSILMTLMASGFNGQSFAFNGYLPIDKKDRNNRIKELERLAFTTGQTQLFMETPFRNESLFKAILEQCNPSTKLTVSIDLTAPTAISKTHSIQKWRELGVPQMHKIPAMFGFGK